MQVYVCRYNNNYWNNSRIFMKLETDVISLVYNTFKGKGKVVSVLN